MAQTRLLLKFVFIIKIYFFTTMLEVGEESTGNAMQF